MEQANKSGSLFCRKDRILYFVVPHLKLHICEFFEDKIGFIELLLVEEKVIWKKSKFSIVGRSRGWLLRPSVRFTASGDPAGRGILSGGIGQRAARGVGDEPSNLFVRVAVTSAGLGRARCPRLRVLLLVSDAPGFRLPQPGPAVCHQLLLFHKVPLLSVAGAQVLLLHIQCTL